MDKYSCPISTEYICTVVIIPELVMYRNRLVKLCCEIRASEGHEILEARETEGVQHTKSGFALV